MSKKTPILSWREVVKTLKKKGFKVVHQKGSHMYLTDGTHKITVPRHKEIKKEHYYRSSTKPG